MQPQYPLPSLKQVFVHSYRLFKFRADKLFLWMGGLQILLAGLAWVLGINDNPGQSLGSALGIMFFGLFSSALGIFVFIAVSFLLKTTVEKENKTFGEVITLARPKFWPLIGAALLVTAAVTAVLLATVLLIVLLFVLFGNGVFSSVLATLVALGVSVFLLAAVIYITFFNLAIVLQDVPVLKSFRYSFNLVKGRFWRVFGFYLSLAVIVLLIALATLVIQFLCSMLYVLSPVLAGVLIWLLSLLLGVCSSAYAQCATVVFYMNAAGMVTTAPEPAATEENDLL